MELSATPLLWCFYCLQRLRGSAPSPRAPGLGRGVDKRGVGSRMFHVKHPRVLYRAEFPGGLKLPKWEEENDENEH